VTVEHRSWRRNVYCYNNMYMKWRYKNRYRSKVRNFIGELN